VHQFELCFVFTGNIFQGTKTPRGAKTPRGGKTPFLSDASASRTKIKKSVTIHEDSAFVPNADLSLELGHGMYLLEVGHGIYLLEVGHGIYVS